MYILDISNKGIRTDVPAIPGENPPTLVRYGLNRYGLNNRMIVAPRAPRDSTPTFILEVYNKSARAVRGMLERLGGNVEIRLVRDGISCNYHLFVDDPEDPRTNPASPIISMDKNGRIVWTRPNLGIELAKVSLPPKVGSYDDDVLSIMGSMVKLVREFNRVTNGISEHIIDLNHR